MWTFTVRFPPVGGEIRRKPFGQYRASSRHLWSLASILCEIVAGALCRRGGLRKALAIIRQLVGHPMGNSHCLQMQDSRVGPGEFRMIKEVVKHQLTAARNPQNNERRFPSSLKKRQGLSLGFVSDQRPKFTAKAQSSPRLRTRPEPPGADQPILNGKNAGNCPWDLFRAYRPVRTIQCLPPCRVPAMPAACEHAAHVGTPAAFGAWHITVWNAMDFE